MPLSLEGLLAPQEAPAKRTQPGQAEATGVLVLVVLAAASRQPDGEVLHGGGGVEGHQSPGGSQARDIQELMGMPGGRNSGISVWSQVTA